MKKVIAAILSIAAIALPQVAIAQTAPFNAPHKYTDPVTLKKYVFIPGQVAGSPIPNLISQDYSTGYQSVRLNDCGWGSIEYASTLFKAEVTDNPSLLNWSGRTSGAIPSCGKNSSGAWVSSNNGPIGTVIRAGLEYWIKGGNSWGTIYIATQHGGPVKNKVNNCGFLRVLVSEKKTMSYFKISGVDYQYSTIPSVTKPMICRKSGANYSTYIPL